MVSTQKQMDKDQSQNDDQQMSAFIETMQVLRSLDSEFPIQHALALGIISQNPGMSLTQLAEKLNLNLSTVSRIIGALSDHRANGQPYYMVEVKKSEQERRRKELYLTPKGEAFLKKVEGCF